MIIWLIGLSGSGKTTLGKRVYSHIKKTHPNTVFLDGDDLREVWGDKLGHTIEARAINAHRMSQLSHILDQQGIHVVATVLSIFPNWQKWNRENFSKYHEIFIDTPMEIVQARDPKGIYRLAAEGNMPNVVGIDIDFPRPPNPDHILDMEIISQGEDFCFEEILRKLPPL